MGQNLSRAMRSRYIHRFEHLAEPVSSSSYPRFRHGFFPHRRSSCNIQLLLLTAYNIGRRDKASASAHGCGEVHNALFPLGFFYLQRLEHLTSKIISNGLHMAMLLAAQEISGPGFPDHIPHGDFKPAAQIREFPDG